MNTSLISLPIILEKSISIEQIDRIYKDDWKGKDEYIKNIEEIKLITDKVKEDTKDLGQYEKVKYVYGLATDIDYRKKGLCKRMLLFAKNYFNCPLVLKPQDEKVASMYGKMGFVRLHGSEQFNITDEIVKAFNIIDKEDYTKDLMILY